MLDRDTGVVVERTLKNEGGAVPEFYAAIPPPVVVGIGATGSMGWFLRLMEELAIECRVGHPTAIRFRRGSPFDSRAIERSWRANLTSNVLSPSTVLGAA